MKLPVRNKTKVFKSVSVQDEQKRIRTQIRQKIHQLSAQNFSLFPFSEKEIESHPEEYTGGVKKTHDTRVHRTQESDVSGSKRAAE
jgi:hypothetical protein